MPLEATFEIHLLLSTSQFQGHLLGIPGQTTTHIVCVPRQFAEDNRRLPVSRAEECD